MIQFPIKLFRKARRDMEETCILLKAKDFFSPDLPIAVFRGKNTRAMYNAETHVLYRRDFWKIFYIYSGTGILVINGKRYPFGPGFICLIHPDDLTTFELESDITLSNILFQKKVIADWLGELKGDNDFFSIFEIPHQETRHMIRDQLYLINSNRKIQTLVQEMRREYLRNDPNSAMMLKLYLTELLIRMTRLSSRTFSRKRRGSMIAYVLSRIEQNYMEPFDYQKAAADLGITHIHLCNTYRKEYGESIGQTLFRIRIKNTKRLLLETKKPVIEISTLCGFNDLSYFYRAFRKETGISPGEFRKKFALFS